MADAVKCCICKHYEFGSDKCSMHPEGIPKDVFTQVKACPQYAKNEINDKYDFPIATTGN